MDNSDLALLVNNLQNSVNNITASFNNVQNTLSSLNQYDSTFNSKINNGDIQDGIQDGKISNLEIVDISALNRLSVLEAKFPITDSSLLDETIDQTKIKNLDNDLSGIVSSIALTQADILQFKIKEANDISSLQNNLNNHITVEIADVLALNNKWVELNSSIVGTTTNPFQPQIDYLKTNQVNDEAAILTLSTNQASLQSDNINNKSNISSLQSDNVINKNNISLLQTDNTNNKTNILNLQSLANNNQAAISAQVTKQANDLTTTNNSLGTLNALLASNYNTLSTNLATQVAKEQNDINTLTSTINQNYNNLLAADNVLTNNLSAQITKEQNDINTLTNNLSSLQSAKDQDIAVLQVQVSNNKNNLDTVILVYDNKFLLDEQKINSLENKQLDDRADIVVLKDKNIVDKADIVQLKADVVIDKALLVTHSNNLISVGNSLQTDRNDINLNSSDIIVLKNYDIQNSVNINSLSVIQSQHTSDINTLQNIVVPNLDNLYVKKLGDTMNGKLQVAEIDNDNNPLNIGLNASVINLGGLSNIDNKVINIGGSNDVVNILGTTNYIQTTNTKIENKVILLNDGAVGNNQSAGVGLHFKDNDEDNKGYILVGENSTSLDFKAPQNDKVFKIKETPIDFYDLTHKLYVDGKDAILQANINLLNANQTELTNQISTVNNNVLSDIPFSKINAFPSDNTKVLFGDGLFRSLDVYGVSQSYVDDNLLLKSDKTYVDNNLLLKSDILYVDNGLSVQASNNDILYVKKLGDTMVGKLKVAEIDNDLNPLLIGENASTITIGSLSNIDNKVINIGGANDVVNILGSTNYIQTTNTKVQNKVMILNDGAVGNNQSAGVGLHFKDNDVDNKGYMIVGANGTSLDFKAPQNDNVFKIKENPTDNYDLTNKLYVDNYIRNLLSTMPIYADTVNMTLSTMYTLTQSTVDLASITIPVEGTYEIIMNVVGSAEQSTTITNTLYNYTTSSTVNNSLYTILSNNAGTRIIESVSKSLIIKNIPANTIFKLRSKQNTTGTTTYILNNSTNGYTYLSYKRLGFYLE